MTTNGGNMVTVVVSIVFLLFKDLGLLLDGGKDLLELLVGGSEFLAADVEKFLAALGVVRQVIDAALRVLHLLYKLFQFGNSLGISHFFILFHFLLNYEFHKLN